MQRTVILPIALPSSNFLCDKYFNKNHIRCPVMVANAFKVAGGVGGVGVFVVVVTALGVVIVVNEEVLDFASGESLFSTVF